MRFITVKNLVLNRDNIVSITKTSAAKAGKRGEKPIEFYLIHIQCVGAEYNFHYELQEPRDRQFEILVEVLNSK